MIKKLSLAALVAMGGMSFASATPLTEAIKNVNLNGMLRIRFYNEQPEKGGSYNKWRTNGVFIFKIPAGENVGFVFRNSTQTYLTHTESDNSGLTAANGQSVDSTMVNNLLFMTYHKDGLNFIGGKIPVATPITSVDSATPTHGAGAIATYNFGNGFTAAAGFVTALKNVASATVDNYHYIGNTINNDTSVAAVLYNNDAVKAQVWYFNVEHVLDYDVVARADLDLFKLANIQNDYDVQFHVDYAASELDDAVLNNADTKQFINVNVKGKVAKAALRVGYAYSSDDAGVIDLSIDSPLASSQAHTQQFYDIANERDCGMFYADGSYNILPALKMTLAYGYVDTSSTASKRSANLGSDLNEYTVQFDYKYNKKLSFQAYYDYADFDASGSDNGEIRLQSLYKF